MAEIYAISDDLLMPENLALRYTREILECGVKFFQFRSKKAVKNEKLASEILNLCEKFGAKFIVNDDVKFAKKIGAKAVHLGKDDENIKEAFEILGKDAYVGVSCYNDINLAINAAKNGASYVAFGSVFTSPTKPNASLPRLFKINGVRKKFMPIDTTKTTIELIRLISIRLLTFEI